LLATEVLTIIYNGKQTRPITIVQYYKLQQIGQAFLTNISGTAQTAIVFHWLFKGTVSEQGVTSKPALQGVQANALWLSYMNNCSLNS
jgi:hypothetical protein